MLVISNVLSLASSRFIKVRLFIYLISKFLQSTIEETFLEIYDELIWIRFGIE